MAETTTLRGALVMSYPFNEQNHPDRPRKFPAALKSGAQLFFLGRWQSGEISASLLCGENEPGHNP